MADLKNFTKSFLAPAGYHISLAAQDVVEYARQTLKDGDFVYLDFNDTKVAVYNNSAVEDVLREWIKKRES